MRLLKRNCSEAVYWPYESTEEHRNAYGQRTGENFVNYGNAVFLERVNFSIPNGHASQELFGKDTPYTHVMLVDDDVVIEEHGLIMHNERMYEITAVRKSLNVLSVALKRTFISQPPIGQAEIIS